MTDKILFVRQHMIQLAYVGIILSLFSGASHAQNKGAELEKFVASIRSVGQVKQALKQRMAETCGTGSCFNNNATEICSYIGALDERLNNLITNSNPNFVPKPELQISAPDVELMKRIWKQCKPSSYQYWNYGVMLHVIYDPDPSEDIAIRKLLGLKGN